jgi:hypothetical protein
LTKREVMYIGTRQDSGNFVFVQEGRKIEALPPRNDVRNHSPDGFEWGYNGSGPAQLALAICIHALDGDIPRACRIYQDFKFRVIAAFNRKNGRWEISRREVREVIAVLESQREPICLSKT